MTAWLGRLWGPLIGTAVVGGLLMYVNALRHGTVLNIAVAVALGACLTVLAWNLGDLGSRVVAATWFRHGTEESVPPQQMDYRLTRLRRDLRDTVDRNDRADAIRPLLLELAVTRLRVNHDVGIEDTEAARALLTDEVYSYLTTPRQDTGRRSTTRLRSVVDRIEAL